MSTPECLDPDTAASYASNALPRPAREQVEQHIDGCTACRELVSLVAASAWSTDGGPPRTDPGGPGSTETVATPGRQRPSSSDMPQEVLQRGVRIGPFEIRHPLSAGGMGVVYVAYDARLDRQVALKSVRDRRGDTQQLLNEAKLMAQASHPNVVPVYEVVEANGQIYIAMELVVGRTLGQWMREAPRTWRDVIDVFLEAGQGLAGAHALGIVHGDVKPANILVGDDGRVRVTDFGIASFASDAGETVGLIRGTPAYMAPEQRTGGAADFRCDQYAFAVSLHEALHGALPGQAPTRRTSVPGSVRRSLARALADAPAARFGSMVELLRALRSARLARWRFVTAGAVVALTLVASSFAVGGRRVQAEQCAQAAAQLESPWTPANRDKARAAFTRTGLSYAAETLTRVEHSLEGWAESHARALKAACEPGWLSGDVPLQRFTDQLQCLKESTREARALVTQLADADTAVVLHAVAAAQALAPAEVCNAPAKTAVTRGAATKESDAVRDQLAKARALAASGRYQDAVKVAAEAVKAAEALNDPALLAAAKCVYGGDQSLAGRYEEAAVTLTEAIRLAEVAQEDRARAHAWADLLTVEYALGHHDQVLIMGDAALGAAQRIDDVRLVSDVMQSIGSSMSDKGKAKEAKAMLEKAVELREGAYGAKDRRTATALSVLANAIAMGGDLEGAAQAHRRALEAAEAAFGPAHPETAIIRQNLGDDYLYGLQLKPAIEQLSLAAKVLTQSNGAKSREVLLASTDLGFAYLLDGQTELALATFERLAAEWSEAFPKHPVRGMALLGKFQASVKLGKPGSVEDLKQAVALGGDLPPFELGREQLELALQTKDEKLLQQARENLRSVAMPLIAAELQRAEGAGVR